ncbi:TlpA disulfide reductase family protein [Fibrella aquatilis]|uniref:Redoxin domain-containing protein n=1 Tax=Fibrella aquatilis TaxID=2817059 RepID=A0A939G7I4_9BACT|nr:TlpA disulfide reductase family protein [Fibrella aquatilis]MBO0932653.1 redoxin domain-containing protein [Fibrella aquatilis]
MNRLLTLAFFLLTTPLLAQFRYLPEKPLPGDVVSFTYTPRNTPLASETAISGIWVRYAAPSQMVASLPTTATAVQEGNAFVGEMKLPKPPLSGLLFTFQSKTNSALIDANNGHFYPLLVYTDGGKPQPHATGGQASVLVRTAYAAKLKVKSDWAWAVQQYERELAQNPQLRPQYWSDLIATQLRLQKPGAKATALNQIPAYLDSHTPTPDELTTAANLYDQLAEPARATAARERIRTVDPTGDAAQKARAEVVRKEADLAKKLSGFASFTQAFPASTYRGMLVSSVAEAYFKPGQFRDLVSFLAQQPLPATDPMLLHSFAGQMTDEGRGIPQAEWLAQRALTVLQQRPLPKKASPEQTAQRTSDIQNFRATLAYAFDQQDRFGAALATYKQAVAEPDASDPRTSERLWLCALRANRADSVLPYIEKVVRVGRLTPRLRSALRAYQAKKLGSEAKGETYVRDLLAPYRAERQAELAESFVNQPAPGFTLSTLSGNTVSLASLRGKVVMLDFWATWCGPCVASFPAVQQAAAYFKNDPNVVFLFVNTREGGPLSRVQSFMARQTSTFTVPLDRDQRVADSYGVLGIPTKVIIDPKGRVRYRSLGFSGNTDATAEELTLVIEALKNLQ